MGGGGETWFEIYGARIQSVENSCIIRHAKLNVNHSVSINASSKQKFFAASNILDNVFGINSGAVTAFVYLQNIDQPAG